LCQQYLKNLYSNTAPLHRRHNAGKAEVFKAIAGDASLAQHQGLTGCSGRRHDSGAGELHPNDNFAYAVNQIFDAIVGPGSNRQELNSTTD
jgi:hypothetical protein